MNNKIEAVIFDVDGVLLDSMPSLNALPSIVLQKLGIEPEPNLGQTLFAETFETACEYMIKRYNLKYSSEQLYEALMDYQTDIYINEIMPKKYAKETLEYLKQSGIPMVIATSNERYLCEEAMKKHGFYDYFSGIITSPEVGNTKEEPDIFYAALELLGKPKQNTVLFEDGLHAIITANNMGLPVIGVFDQESSHLQTEIRKRANQYVTGLDKWLDSPVAKNLAF
ncbi:MAG: HAD family phosphatase [Clostridiaceae bacterium]|nr:HAD family phosphatase [Clostridiaceae bacterium]